MVNLLRIQHERQRKEYFPGLGEYIRLFGLTKARAKLLKPDCLIMHPGPINRGVEIDSELADGPQSVILDQVTNGLAVRMAVLYLCGGIANAMRYDHPQRPHHRSGEQSRRSRRSCLSSTGGSSSNRSRQSRRAIEEIDATGLIVCPGSDRHSCPSPRAGLWLEGNDRIGRAGRGGGWIYDRGLHAEHVAGRGQPEHDRLDQGSGRAKWPACNVLPTGAISKNLAGEELAPIGSLAQAGVVAITDDGHCIQNNELMRRAVEYARMVGLPVLDHCQDYNLVGNGVVHEGYWSTLLGLPGWPAAGEEVIVARNILLAELCDHHIHCQHISAAGSVRLLREARSARGEDQRRSLSASHRAHR